MRKKNNFDANKEILEINKIMIKNSMLDKIIKYLVLFILIFIALFIISLFISELDKASKKEKLISEFKLIKIDKNVFAINDYNKKIPLNYVISDTSIKCLESDVYCFFENNAESGYLLKINNQKEVLLFDNDSQPNFMPFYKLCQEDSDCKIFIDKNNVVTVLHTNNIKNENNEDLSLIDKTTFVTKSFINYLLPSFYNEKIESYQ